MMVGAYGCCGVCRWHTIDDGEWVCTNPESENYSLETEYSDGCEEQERRR